MRYVGQPFRLKEERRGDYDLGSCAASRCVARAECVDAAKQIWPFLVPLCGRHWEMKCDWEDEQDSAAASSSSGEGEPEDAAAVPARR